MSVKVTLGDRRTAGATSSWAKRFTEQATPGTPLDDLLQTLSKRHPDLAPILEDATHQEDLEILVNDRPMDAAAADHYKIRDGDSVTLLLK
jgi:molybdopterin converting factor small subunit